MKDSVGRVAILGLGLIGGSIGLGLRRWWVEIASGIEAQKISVAVAAYDTDKASLQAGLKLGVADQAYDDLAEALKDADLLVLAVPVGAMPHVLKAVKGLLEEARNGDHFHLDPDLVITDTGSVKSSVINAAKEVFGEMPPNLVPGHPLAGSEQHGVTAARGDLFEGHRVILTPEPETDLAAIDKVKRLWRLLGAEVEEMSAATHDALLAQVSHLPHLLAYTLVDAINPERSKKSSPEREENSLERSNENLRDPLRFAAGGFRDFTRIASSDPVMWRDIALANRGPLLEAMDSFGEHLAALRRAVAEGDGEAITEIFAAAKTIRDAFANGPANNAAADKRGTD